MKSTTNIILAVLAIAIAILYFLHFSSTSISSDPSGESEAIYYINVDTLNEKLTFLKVKQEDLEAREISFEAKLREKTAALEKEIGEYQRQAQGGYLTPKQMQTMEQRLGRKQQELMAERDSIGTELLNESQAINDELMKKLKSHIEEFRKDNPSKYILAYSENSNILYADKSQDITNEILEKMNTQD